jgi:MFS family permease
LPLEPAIQPHALRTARLLLAGRFARSVWQGALVVDFVLYLHAMGWTPLAISMVLAGALVLGAALTLVLGPLSDRFGRRRFLLAYDAVQGIAAAVAALATAPAPLAIAAIVGGFGRGGNGAAGPFAPVEQAWLAWCIPPARRGTFYGYNAASGFLGNAAGALLAGVPGWIGGAAPPAAAYRPLFWLTAVLSAVTFVLIRAGHDGEAAAEPPPQADTAEQSRENSLMFRMALANLLNGTGLGLTGPLITYWFAVRFDHGPGSIGPLFALGFLLAAASSLAGGRLGRRIGVVRAVVAMRLAALALLILLPFAGSFAMAGLIYTARTVLNRGTTGGRAAVSVGIVRASRRGLASALANVALQIPRALGPVLAGMLYETGMFAAPFFIAAAFQAGYLWLYDRSFRHLDLR